MLNRRYRFHSRGGVRYTYQHGKSIRGNKITLVHAKNSRGRERYAVVVSKKIAKSAVKRNRIRRRVYEAIRLVKQEKNVDAKKDNIFVIYAKDVETMPFQDLKALISSLLKQSML
ncbi:ribonuclease P protein component [Candidatus Saccharibacteria bacterium]|nr:ribonuclease P protein component [Candidatus Saccharibacteria bacterium]